MSASTFHRLRVDWFPPGRCLSQPVPPKLYLHPSLQGLLGFPKRKTQSCPFQDLKPLSHKMLRIPGLNPTVQFSCSAMSDSLQLDCSIPGFPVHHQLLEHAQTHVHQVGDAIQPSHPLPSLSPPAFDLCQNQGLFQ